MSSALTLLWHGAWLSKKEATAIGLGLVGLNVLLINDAIMPGYCGSMTPFAAAFTLWAAQPVSRWVLAPLPGLPLHPWHRRAVVALSGALIGGGAGLHEAVHDPRVAIALALFGALAASVSLSGGRRVAAAMGVLLMGFAGPWVVLPAATTLAVWELAVNRRSTRIRTRANATTAAIWAVLRADQMLWVVCGVCALPLTASLTQVPGLAIVVVAFFPFGVQLGSAHARKTPFKAAAPSWLPLSDGQRLRATLVLAGGVAAVAGGGWAVSLHMLPSTPAPLHLMSLTPPWQVVSLTLLAVVSGTQAGPAWLRKALLFHWVVTVALALTGPSFLDSGLGMTEAQLNLAELAPQIPGTPLVPAERVATLEARACTLQWLQQALDHTLQWVGPATYALVWGVAARVR